MTHIHKWPRQPCTTCGRPVAVMPSGRFFRHDPPGRRTVGASLVSCDGSLERAPKYEGLIQPELFENQPLEDVGDGSLFRV
jgi:hypothetical protein